MKPRKRKGYVYDPKFLETLFALKAFQIGDRVLISESDVEAPGEVMLVHSMDDDEVYPLNMVFLDNRGALKDPTNSDWDVCFGLKDVVAWRPRKR